MALSEHRLKFPPQRRIERIHRDAHVEISEARHPVPWLRYSAGHDACKMREIAIDVDCYPMQRDPALYANADRGDLVLAVGGLVGPAHPHADAITPPLAGNAEARERAYYPFFEIVNEAAHIPRAPVQIEHHIDDPLPGAVIGELAAAPGRSFASVLS